MLEKTLELEHGSKDRKRADRFWRESLWTFISSLTLVALFPVGLGAQTAPAPAQGAGIGTGVQTPLRFGGESAPNNLASLSFGLSTLYDDNVNATDSPRVGDEAVSFRSQLMIMRQTEHMTLNFGYTPFFVFYRQHSQFDQLNHSANLNFAY